MNGWIRRWPLGYAVMFGVSVVPLWSDTAPWHRASSVLFVAVTVFAVYVAVGPTRHIPDTLIWFPPAVAAALAVRVASLWQDERRTFESKIITAAMAGLIVWMAVVVSAVEIVAWRRRQGRRRA